MASGVQSPALSTLGYEDMDQLNDRLCALRIQAIVDVINTTDHPVPPDVVPRLTPGSIFQREEQIMAEGRTELARTCRSLLALVCGAPVLPPDPPATDVPPQRAGQSPDFQMDTDQGNCE